MSNITTTLLSSRTVFNRIRPYDYSNYMCLENLTDSDPSTVLEIILQRKFGIQDCYSELTDETVKVYIHTYPRMSVNYRIVAIIRVGSCDLRYVIS